MHGLMLVLNAFSKIIIESDYKLNTLWVDQGREFYNKFIQERFDNNDILLYSTYIEDKSIIAERFIETLKAKIYKKRTANDINSCRSYFNKLVDQYNNTCHYSIDKKPINADYSASTEKTIPKALKSKVNDRIRTFLVKVILKIGQ